MTATAHLRFGDGDLGRMPAAGTVFDAAYRVGNGSAGTSAPRRSARSSFVRRPATSGRWCRAIRCPPSAASIPSRSKR